MSIDSGTLSISIRSGRLWIVLPDSITIDNCNHIEKEILSNFDGKVGQVVIDISRVNSLYSSGLGLMIRLRKFVQNQGGDLCIVNISKRLHEMLIALNLDRVFPIYSTDVEYEISQEDTWKNLKKSLGIGFLLVSQIEDDLYRINLSGEMVKAQDLSSCGRFVPNSQIAVYVFDLSSLEHIDTYGAAQFKDLLIRIIESGGECRAFGAQDLLIDVLNLLELSSYLTFYKDEKSALIGKNPL